MGLIPEIVNRRRILDLAWWSMAISPSARFKNRMRLAAPISKQRRPLTHTGSLRPLPDSIRSRKSDAQMGILTAWRRPKQNKRVRGKSGETESGFARLPRCRPAESDLARSARKSKKSYCAPGRPFQDVGRSRLFLETQGLPEHQLGASMRRGGGRRVPLAHPKAREQGHSERDREGCDTKPLYYTEQSRLRPAQHSPAENTPQGRPIPKRAIPP